MPQLIFGDFTENLGVLLIFGEMVSPILKK
jgi:hypothetical protein